MTKVQIRRLDDYNLPPLQEAVDEFLNQEFSKFNLKLLTVLRIWNLIIPSINV